MVPILIAQALQFHQSTVSAIPSFITCKLYNMSFTYSDLSALPDKAPHLLLSAPTASAPAFIAVALSLSMVFLITFTLISFREKLGEKLGASLNKPLLQRLSAWVGFFGFMIGMG